MVIKMLSTPSREMGVSACIFDQELERFTISYGLEDDGAIETKPPSL
jgi:hypothetical protein